MNWARQALQDALDEPTERLFNSNATTILSTAQQHEFFVTLPNFVEELRSEYLEKTKSDLLALRKLGLILFMMELSKRLEGTGVTINSMHPGVVQTELLNDVPKLFTLIFKLIARTPAKGASTAVYLATSPEVEKVSGKLFADEKPVAIGGQAKEPGLGERLWRMSASLTGLPAA